ncbi:hypothetical protein Goari_017959, partial [Gossypium aridum]|nr:hypothetical protein [Gossypium aridum]
EDTNLGWNLTKETVDTSHDWWESRLKVVLEAQNFRTLGIDPEFERKLDHMFIGIVVTSDKVWALSLGTLPSEIFEDVDNDILKENEKENAINDFHISSQVMSMVGNSSGDGSDDEREKNEILQHMESFNQLFHVAYSFVQLYYGKYIEATMHGFKTV